MTMEIDDFRDELFAQIRNLKINGLISITLVGSFQYAKKLEAINDVDIIILVNKLEPDLFNRINNLFKKISGKLETGKRKVVVENRIAPLKPRPVKGKTVVQLHLLIHDTDLWEDRSTTIRFDWTNFRKTLVGKNLPRINKIKRKDLLRDFKINKQNIRTKSALGRVFKAINGKVIAKRMKVKISTKEYYEVIVYSIITAFVNYLRFYNPNTKKDKAVIIEKAKILPIKYQNTLEMAFKIKELIRNEKSPLIKLQELKISGIDFIEYLEKAVKA